MKAGSHALLFAVSMGFAWPCAAANVIAVATQDPDLTAGILEALKGAAYHTLDLDQVAGELLGLGDLPLGKIDVRPADFWPGELQGLWIQGAQACKERAGPPPYNLRNSSAFVCGRELGKALWQKYLEHRGIWLVIERGRQQLTDPIEGPGVLRLALYHPAEESERTLTAPLPQRTGQQRRLAGQLALRLLKGEGQTQDRGAVRHLPTPPRADSPELWEGHVQELPGEKLPQGCPASALPATLELEPERAPLAQTLALHWKATVASDAAGAPLKCTLRMIQFEGNVMPEIPARSVEATLVCGDRRLLTRTIGLTAGTAGVHKSLSTGLIQKLLSLVCPK